LRGRLTKSREDGVSRKPLPYKKTPPDVRSLCRAHTDALVRRLASIALQPPKDTPLATSNQAAQILLDRGWGRPHQTVSGEDGDDIRITIRKMLTDDEEIKK
jgi:hypothetical protein